MSDDEIRGLIREAQGQGLILVKAKVLVPLCEEVLRLRGETLRCPTCDGDGWVGAAKCGTCGGDGKIKRRDCPDA